MLTLTLEQVLRTRLPELINPYLLYVIGDRDSEEEQFSMWGNLLTRNGVFGNILVEGRGENRPVWSES